MGIAKSEWLLMWYDLDGGNYFLCNMGRIEVPNRELLLIIMWYRW